MADYIYLLENRLSQAQRDAVRTVAELARAKTLTVFLVGGAVRDLTTGSPVRDLDLVVQGYALKLRKDLERAGATISGEYAPLESLYLRFAGGVRMELSSTLTITWPKPGKPVARSAGIQDDLRRRDFTANAMALSLNQGSYGLLMDPLNGVADIENRELRLISTYGFIEEPVRMIRAARLMARLGWQMEERTATRYRTGQEENYIETLSDFHRGYETEEIFHEEDPLRVLDRMQAEGWMTHLAPFLTRDKVNVAELERLREVQTRLQMQGIQPDSAAANFPLLTAKLTTEQIATLKASFPRKGFVTEIDELEAQAKLLTAQLTGKQTARASETWKLLHQAAPEVVLAVAYGSRSAQVQTKFKSFESEWPQARQRIPYQLMQEMRIVPELAGYADLVEEIFFELMDGNFATPEAMRAYLEPHSPPAPPPPVNLRKARAAKKEAKPAKARSRKPVGDTDEDGSEAVIDVAAESTPESSPAPPAPQDAVAVATARPDEVDAPVDLPVIAKARPKTVNVSAAPVKLASAPAKAVSSKALQEKSVSAQVKAAPVKVSTAITKPEPAAKLAEPEKTSPVKMEKSGQAAKLAGQTAVKAKAVKATPVPAKVAVPAKSSSKAKKVAAKPAKIAAKKTSAVVSVKRGSAVKAAAKPIGKVQALAKPAAKTVAKPAAKPPLKKVPAGKGRAAVKAVSAPKSKAGAKGKTAVPAGKPAKKATSAAGTGGTSTVKAAGAKKTARKR